MAATRSKRYWSGKVTRESDALDLARDVFTWDNAKRIAASLRTSAERSTRRKADPFRSAMSMLVFYINRAGKNLAEGQRKVLETAKEELRKQFGKATAVTRKPAARRTTSRRPAAAKRSRVGKATRAALVAGTRGKKGGAKPRRRPSGSPTKPTKSARAGERATRSRTA